MKQIIYIFIFIPFLSYSQDIKSDSSFISVTNGVVFNTRIIQYENGTETTTKTPIGDISVVNQNFISEILGQTSTMANDVKYVSQFKSKITEIIRKDAANKSVIGKSALWEIGLRDTSYFMSQDYTFSINDGGSNTIVFSKTSSNFKYKIGTSAEKNIVYLGNIIRLRNYSGTKDLDLYKISESLWVSIDRSVILRRTKVNR